MVGQTTSLNVFYVGINEYQLHVQKHPLQLPLFTGWPEENQEIRRKHPQNHTKTQP